MTEPPNPPREGIGTGAPGSHRRALEERARGRKLEQAISDLRAWHGHYGPEAHAALLRVFPEWVSSSSAEDSRDRGSLMAVTAEEDPANPGLYILRLDGREIGEMVRTEADDLETWTVHVPEKGWSHDIPARPGRPPKASAVTYVERLYEECDE